MKQWAQHGTVRRYRQGGCADVLSGGEPGAGDRCAECKKAMAQRTQQKKAGLTHINTVTPVTSIDGRRRSNGARAQSNPRPNTSNLGPTEAAVYTQLEQFRAEHPVRVEMALCAARILDNPDARNMHSSTMRQMNEIIDKLTAKKKTKSGGRLASVQAMVGRRSG